MAKGMLHEAGWNKTVEWYTPKGIFDALGIQFDLDPCSPGRDSVPWISVDKCYSIADKQDGLMLPWFGNVWMNPPYGKETPAWLERFALHGNGIALLFARTETIWFHKFVPKATAICFVKGKICFVSENEAEAYASSFQPPKGRPGAGSVLIAYGEENAKALERSQLGLTLWINNQRQ